MPATVTLSTTTLSKPLDEHEGVVTLASVSGLFPGYRLYVDQELMAVNRVGVGTQVHVIRGVDGTSGAAHVSGSTVTIGQAHQFYYKDPAGTPPEAVPVSPWINVLNGKVWYAQGDPTPTGGNQRRWWQQQTTTYSVGPLGVRTTTLDPTSST